MLGLEDFARAYGLRGAGNRAADLWRRKAGRQLEGVRKRQSPKSTAMSLPQFAASVSRPRRISASSMTSSWTKVAK